MLTFFGTLAVICLKYELNSASILILFPDTCSHEISHVYYSKTIPDPTIYLATQCLVLEKNLFFSIYSYNESCKDGKKAYMGDKITKNAQGDFHLVIKTVAYEPLDIE